MTDAAPTLSNPGLISWLRAADPLLLLLRASMLALLVNSNDDTAVFVTVALLCVVVLPREPMLRSPWLWGALFVGIGLRQLLTWHTIDDHIIATTYWCGAVALGLTARRPLPTLAASARFLVGSLFAFAAGWKLFSGQFLDGTFFRYTLLFDDRFEVVARTVGGTSDAVRQANIDEVSALLGGSGEGVVELEEGARNGWVAQTFTWWGVAIEAAIAAAFLAPLAAPWGWLRHATLVAFAATTYLVVPIGGFGTLLLILGLAISRTATARAAYCCGAIALLAWAGIWPLVFL